MKKHIFILLLILFFACVFRLYKFSSPIADWHSWRQADTSSVSRTFVQEGFDLLHPRFQDLSNVPSGKENPQGYRFVEFPIYNVFQAGLSSVFTFFTLEEWGRMVTILGVLISTLFLYALVARHANPRIGLWSAFFFAFLPYNIYYGRAILPDPLMVTATLGGIYFFDVWVSGEIKGRTKNISYFVFSALFTAAALLLKPFAVFFFLPLVALSYQEYRLGMFKKWQLYVFALFSILPLLFWRWWMLQYPEGIPVNDWLFNGGNIRFKGAFFYWVFGDHIGRLILGYVGYGLIGIGLLAAASTLFLKQRKDRLFFLSFLAATLLYLFIVARGNVQHDYYQIPVVPTLAIFLGFGAAFLYTPIQQLNKVAGRLLLVAFISFTFFFSWYHIRDFFNINNPNIVIAGKVVDKLTPKNAKVLTFYDGDTSFLYQTNRKGWASLEKPLPEMISMGASFLVIVNPTQKDMDGLGREYMIVASDPRYLLLKLQ